jgi:hypothetical protein
MRHHGVTQTQTHTPTQTIVDGYFAMWNETDTARRRETIAAVWAPEASYVDPMFVANGREGLDALVAGLHQQYPGHRFSLVGSIDVHHDRARWAWEFLGPDGATVASGVDFAVLAADGKLRDVTGFFQAPSGAAA